MMGFDDLEKRNIQHKQYNGLKYLADNATNKAEIMLTKKMDTGYFPPRPKRKSFVRFLEQSNTW